MQYLGVLAMLGRVSARLPRNDEAHYGIARAFQDANTLLRRTGSHVLFDKSSSGGYAAFPAEEVHRNYDRRTALAKTARSTLPNAGGGK
jgi:hypothetical protein